MYEAEARRLLLCLYSLPSCPGGGSVFDQSVDVVLGPVLAGGHLEHVGDAEQGLPGLPVGDHLGYTVYFLHPSVPRHNFVQLGSTFYKTSLLNCQNYS